MKFEKWKRWFEKYERVLIPGTLVFGVLVDFVTFRSINIETAFLILEAHVLVAAASIVALNVQRPMRYLPLVAPLTLQFSFGALLSASLIFYWFSGTISVSWPLIAIIAILMTSNEVLRHYYLRPTIQISVYYFILFSLLILLFPFVFNSIDVALFVYAGLGSLILIALFVAILARFFDHIRPLRPRMAASIFSIFALMNIFYFFDMIPPIPLSLREAGVYHAINVADGAYTLLAEKETLIDKFLPGQTIHLQKGKRVYVYSAIFAPAKLQTTIFHRWKYFDEEKNTWIDKDRLSFSITGGRDDGYRGYSLKTVLASGKWRVNVETKRGQVLGHIGFEVVDVAESPDLITVVR